MAGVNSSGFWGPNIDSYSLLDNKMPRLNSMRRVVNRDGYRATRALVAALVGAVTGGTALATHSRVSHARQTVDSGIPNPGEPRIIVVTDINRATTAADVTALNEFLVNVSTKPVFPRDLSGNGGPAQS